MQGHQNVLPAQTQVLEMGKKLLIYSCVAQKLINVLGVRLHNSCLLFIRKECPITNLLATDKVEHDRLVTGQFFKMLVSVTAVRANRLEEIVYEMEE